MKLRAWLLIICALGTAVTACIPAILCEVVDTSRLCDSKPGTTVMEQIEFAIDLVHYEPPRSRKPLNSLSRTDCLDPIEPLSMILLLIVDR